MHQNRKINFGMRLLFLCTSFFTSCWSFILISKHILVMDILAAQFFFWTASFFSQPLPFILQMFLKHGWNFSREFVSIPKFWLFLQKWAYYQYRYNKPGSFCYLKRSWKKIFWCNILCNIRVHHSFEDVWDLNN